jgi:hypothetical protein
MEGIEALYIIAWKTGHNPPRVLYYYQTETGWGGTYKRTDAMVFTTPRLARKMYDSKHRFPEDFAHCWENGTWRIEPLAAPMLPF